ncbi:MAG TPA: tyrosine--tRNA ligase [Candidatus Bipolaricaulota bacterium]|nr:tyrosine--tRNA ligase [Candidatus Bipolaricaulota bacterium]
MNTNTNEQLIEELLFRGVENIYPSREFLEEKLKSGENLTIYLGIDPTGPNLHLGHAIPLLKLRQFQRLGHQVVMLIGDFTGMIGDPTDKTAARVRLTRQQVLENCKNYKKQASKILDFTGKNKVEVKYNSKWLAKMLFGDVLELAAYFTVQRLLERDMFEKRMKEGKPIHLHEFLYPLMQGYDSVVMNVDGEVGGNDQTFNMLAGRTLMKQLKDKEKFVITMKLLADPTGKKMGKTEGNMVTLSDSPEEMFGKVMSWSDEMIVDGFALITRAPVEEAKEMELRLKSGENPRNFKLRLAKEVVRTFIGTEEADAAEENFVKVFSNKEKPTDIEEKAVSSYNIIDALVETSLVPSRSEAKRAIDQKGVKVNDQIVENYDYTLKAGDLIQKGKRFFVKIK